MEPQNESAPVAGADTPTLDSSSADPVMPAVPVPTVQVAPPLPVEQAVPAEAAVPAEEPAPVETGVTDERVAEYESTADQPDKPGPFQRWYDHVTDDWSREKPWYELPKALGLAQLIGIRDTLRRQNLSDTSRLPAVNPTTAPPFEERFLTERTPDGSWNDSLINNEYATAMACLVLQMPNNYLPIFQR